MKARLDAASWKMNMNAIVITTNVCRRARSAISPVGNRDQPGHDAGHRDQREHPPPRGDP